MVIGALVMGGDGCVGMGGRPYPLLRSVGLEVSAAGVWAAFGAPSRAASTSISASARTRRPTNEITEPKFDILDLTVRVK